MIIIAGLGNPGKEYEGTRHNVGFDTLDVLADKYGISISGFEHHSLVGKGNIKGNKVLLMKPQTYMNLSGVAVRAVLDYYKEDIDSLIIIYDDIALPVGKLRVRGKGSAGGHNGIKSLINELGTQEFNRVRVGVGEKPPRWDLADWVLGRYSSDDKEIMKESFKRAVSAIECIVETGIGSAMNKFNG